MAIPTITNNSPSAGYIAWGAFSIQLNGVVYSVSAGSTNQRWVWWKYNSGAPVITAGAEVPTTLVDDDLVLFANKNGIGVRVQSSNFVDGELLVDGSIFADALSTNLINSQHIVTAGLDASVVKFGTMHGDRIQVGTLSSDRVIVGGGDTTPLGTSLQNYVKARATDLVANGTGYLGTDYNFKQHFTANLTDVPAGALASFVAKTTSSTAAWIDELIPFDPAKKYEFSFKIKQMVAGATNRAYGMLIPYDAWGSTIAPYMTGFWGGTTTTLAAPLNNGDTTVQLADASNWWGSAAKPAGVSNHNRSFIFWNWVDPNGKVWPIHTYSRNNWAAGKWNDGGVVGNTITLAAPWNGGAFPAGHPVSNGSSGGSFAYMPSLANGVISESWTEYSDLYTAGILTPSTAVGASNLFSWGVGMPPGTANVKVGWLLNYAASPVNATVGRQAIASVSFSDASAAAALAAAASASAAAANERWAPPGQTTIDGGKITTNTIVGNKIMGQTIGAEKLIVGDLANMAEVNESYALGALYDGTHVITNGWSARALAVSQYFMFRNNHGPLPFKTGDRIRVAFDAYADVAVTAGVNLWVYGNASLNQSFGTANITTTPTTFDLQATVTVDTNGKTTFMVGLDAIAGKNVYLRNVRAYRMGAGELIVDGAIRATQIKSNEITALQIKGDTITANEIAADTITADEIAADTITANEIAADTITANELMAESVTAEKMEAEVIWSSEQWIGQMHLHPTEGITIPQDGSEVATHFSTNGSGSQFAGTIVANDGLTSYGGVNMQGTDNFLAGELKAGSGVNDPTSAPVITASYDTVSTGETSTVGGFYRKGLSEFHDPGIAVWLTTDTVNGESNVQAWSKAGGPGYWGFDVLAGWSSLGGVTRIGDYYYVLCRQNANTANWRILVYKGSDKAYMGSYDTNPIGGVSIATTSYPAIGHDGTNIMIAWAESNSNLYIRRIIPYGAAGAGGQTGNTLNAGSWSSTVHVQGVQQVGGKIFAGYNNAINAYTPGTTTATRDTAAEFPKNTGALAGLSHDGIAWATFTSGKIFTKHTTNSGRWLWAYDFRDADTGGSGTANTRPSPVRDITPTKFAKWTVSIPQEAPDDLTNDGANTCGIFAAPYGSPLVLQHQLLTDGDGITGTVLSYIKTFTSLSLTGAAPNAVNDFASRSGAIGRFASTIQADGEPTWHGDGDGSGRFGPIKFGATGRSMQQPSTFSGGSHTTPTGAAAMRYPTGLAEGAFVAPMSGNVMIVSTAYLKAAADGNNLGFAAEVRTGGTIRSGTVVLTALPEDMAANYNVQMTRQSAVVFAQGLTPGATYNVYLGVYSNAISCLVNNTKIKVVPIL